VKEHYLKTIDETNAVRNVKTWFALCPDGHISLFDNRPTEVALCTLCNEPKKLTSVGEGFVSHEEKNKGSADSFPEPVRKGPILPDRL
jgi:hypothetical protein